jgi:hypothetical protein
MKCIKNVKTGTVIRLEDRKAENMIGREWEYAPKSEWKKLNPINESPKPKTEKEYIPKSENAEEMTIAEKQLRRKKQK